jgi:hypothetical protein
MAVYGSLKSMSVAELLQWASQWKKTGTLVISTQGVHRRIVFERGMLVYCATDDPTQTFGRLLIEAGHLSEEQHERALDVRRQCNVAIAKVLLDLNAVSEETLARMLRTKAENDIFQVFLCDDGKFCFVEQRLPDLEMLPLHVDITGAVLEVSRRLDEVGRSIPPS